MCVTVAGPAVNFGVIACQTGATTETVPVALQASPAEAARVGARSVPVPASSSPAATAARTARTSGRRTGRPAAARPGGLGLDLGSGKPQPDHRGLVGKQLALERLV